MTPEQGPPLSATLAVPVPVARAYGVWSWTAVSVHEGRSETYRVRSPAGVERYLKLVEQGVYPSLQGEADRSRWARGSLPVPRVIHHGKGAEESGGVEWMVTDALAGIDATRSAWSSDPERTVRALARGLRAFHAAPAGSCPFDFRLDTALEHVRRRADAGAIDPGEAFHDVHQGLSTAEALEVLRRTRPPETDLVVCHGDYCPPNVLLHDWEPVGFVDLGELGVADRWWDLAVATWSVEWNFGAELEAAFLAEYGVELDAPRLRYYRLLYDLVS